MTRLGVDAARAERWRPWRSYALHHLWAVASGPLGDPAPPASQEMTS
jgi:AraC family transcriptional regulator of adaptative response / DNA-3-methyladenine glycosylase II